MQVDIECLEPGVALGGDPLEESRVGRHLGVGSWSQEVIGTFSHVKTWTGRGFVIAHSNIGCLELFNSI